MQLKCQKIIVIGIALLSNCVFANTLFIAPDCYNNFYVGANLGLASLTDKESTNNPINDTHYLSSTGLLGGALVGYDFTLRDQFKLGLEAFANVADLSIADNQNYAPITSYTVNMRDNYGIRLLPGFALTPGTVGHLIVGYSYGKFSINDNGNYGIVGTQFNKSGIQFGAGVTTALFKNISVRFDVLYTDYASQSTNGVTTTTPPGIQSYQNNLAVLEGNLALIYKFA